MASYSTQYYTPAAVPIPSKADQYQQYYQSGGSNYSVSPSEDDQRERDASVTSGVPSYGNSSNAASYATSYTSGDYGDGTQSGGSVNGVDFNDYMQNRFDESFDPIPLDRSLARQAQTSGQLNNKHRELLEMQAKAQARLAKSRARFQQGLNDAREVHADLEWTSKKVSSLKKKAEKHHAKEYQKACGMYPSLN
ncbi:hypothetical protein K445DRAFT_129188 [Daldinia sp. EC12]|uniref:Biogenesis of lysosome-related organelles complex 1 subunit KXD1 n=1 Tax=Daldinia eschscholtzii TaxID=292717 RepID=A0AAX6MQM2_9PEZI|nr:hypothetical protein F4774DRAFT_304126 [Daldinia eschscholtzii]OTB14870.1 hypothetical protein K445DRAFT_129188 [Daldinia sp. EC12]